MPNGNLAKKSKNRKIQFKNIFLYIIAPRKKYVTLDILNMCRFYFGLQGNDCIQDLETAQEVGRRRRPTSSVFFSSSVQSFPWSPKPNLHILSISNGTYFFRGPITSSYLKSYVSKSYG